jgi:hypothetical protein
MLAFLVQTLFALQGTTKRTGSYCSYPLSGVHHVPSPPFIIVETQQRDALFASASSLQDEIIDERGTLDRLQARLGLSDEHSIELAKRFSRIQGYSIEANLKPKLAWLQERLDMDDKKDG